MLCRLLKMCTLSAVTYIVRRRHLLIIKYNEQHIVLCPYLQDTPAVVRAWAENASDTTHQDVLYGEVNI